jgi:hypothetical protein
VIRVQRKSRGDVTMTTKRKRRPCWEKYEMTDKERDFYRRTGDGPVTVARAPRPVAKAQPTPEQPQRSPAKRRRV